MRVVQNRFWPGGSNRTASNSTSNSHLPQQERVRHHFLIRTGNVDYNVVRYCTSFRYQRYQTIISGRGPTSRSYTKQSFPSWPAVLPEPKQKQPFQPLDFVTATLWVWNLRRHLLDLHHLFFQNQLLIRSVHTLGICFPLEEVVRPRWASKTTAYTFFPCLRLLLSYKALELSCKQEERNIQLSRRAGDSTVATKS